MVLIGASRSSAVLRLGVWRSLAAGRYVVMVYVRRVDHVTAWSAIGHAWGRSSYYVGACRSITDVLRPLGSHTSFLLVAQQSPSYFSARVRSILAVAS